jgi:hypothetical protein
MMTVTGTPSSHRIPALAMAISTILFSWYINVKKTSEFLCRTKI